MVSASEDPLDVLGELDVRIQLGSAKTVTHRPVVCRNITQECIIGVDFLQLHGLDVRFSTRTLETTTTTMPFLVKSLYRVE
jgi:hypothetical protein